MLPFITLGCPFRAHAWLLRKPRALPWATIARPIGTPNHEHYTRSVQHKVILIDGQRLSELMIEYNVGVSTVRTIALKRVDSDYFED